MLSFSHFQGKASKRKQVLDEAYGQQGFLADSRDLVNFSHYSHYWNALSFICSRVKSSYIPGSLEMCCKPNMSPAVNKLLHCFDPETVGASLKGHHGPFFGHWCPFWVASTVSGSKQRKSLFTAVTYSACSTYPNNSISLFCRWNLTHFSSVSSVKSLPNPLNQPKNLVDHKLHPRLVFFY